MKRRLILWFLAAQVLLCWFVFRDGLWGKSLLAPLDIAPAFFSHYRYLDPASSGVPANHWIIDQLTYDLPEQWTIYKGYHRGEIPWWDPYNFCGRPLLTDAAISGTDPTRLMLYALLPFEAAYNWIRIVHFILTGLGMLLLLRHFGFRDWQCCLLALAYEFAGASTINFGHPWIQATFLYYPFLWLAWDMAFVQRKWWSFVVAPLLVAAIFYAGSLQSHAYVVVFALAFALGYGRRDWSAWRKLVPILAFSGLIGGCLASPVVFNQIEIYFIGTHGIGTGYNRFSFLEGLVSLAGVYPWSLGTFRTLDASKLFDQPYPLGFVLFIGSAAFLLAILGAMSKTQNAERGAPRRTAIWLCALYFLIASTPLVQLLYLRCATLAVMALVLLAAFGLEEALLRAELSPRFGRVALILTLAVALVTNVLAWVVYPKLQPKVQQFVQTHQSKAFEDAPALRRFQVDNLPAEISFQNPETVTAFLGMLGLSVLLLRPAWRKRECLWSGLLILNLVPVLLFSHRFVPRQPMSQWDRLLAGGPEQQEVVEQMRDKPWRLLDATPGQFRKLFPLAMSHLYEVRTFHGYSSLSPHTFYVLPASEQALLKPQLADWIYESDEVGTSGRLFTNATPGLARFQWQGSPARSFTVDQLGLNTVRVSFAPGSPGHLVWTDTFYPGWEARADGTKTPLVHAEPCFSRIEVPASTHSLVLHYRPRFLSFAEVLVVFGLISIIAVGALVFRKNRASLKTADVTDHSKQTGADTGDRPAHLSGKPRRANLIDDGIRTGLL